jgi:hypothetical protein
MDLFKGYLPPDVPYPVAKEPKKTVTGKKFNLVRPSGVSA